MISKAVRHMLIAEFLTWILVLAFAGLIGALGLHFSVSSTALILTILVLFGLIWVPCAPRYLRATTWGMFAQDQYLSLQLVAITFS